MDMIVVMKAGVTDDEVQRVVERVAELGLIPHPSKGEFRTIVGAIGKRTLEAQQQLEQLPGVDEVMAISQPYKLASREFHEADTILDIKGIRVGGPHVNIIAGPCAIESREILFGVGQAVKDAGASILRGGAYKPRTSPYSFSGMGKEGLELLKEAGEALDMPTITEVVDRAEWGIVNAECRRSIRTPSASAGTSEGRRGCAIGWHQRCSTWNKSRAACQTS